MTMQDKKILSAITHFLVVTGERRGGVLRSVLLLWRWPQLPTWHKPPTHLLHSSGATLFDDQMPRSSIIHHPTYLVNHLTFKDGVGSTQTLQCIIAGRYKQFCIHDSKPFLSMSLTCQPPCVDSRGNRGGSVCSAFDSGPMCCRFESHPRNWTFRLSPNQSNQRPWYVQPRLCDWAYKRPRATYR